MRNFMACSISKYVFHSPGMWSLFNSHSFHTTCSTFQHICWSCSPIFFPFFFAHRKAKIVSNFGLSECKRVNHAKTL